MGIKHSVLITPQKMKGWNLKQSQFAREKNIGKKQIMAIVNLPHPGHVHPPEIRA